MIISGLRIRYLAFECASAPSDPTTTSGYSTSALHHAASFGMMFASVQFQIRLEACACHAAPVYQVFVLPCKLSRLA